MPWKETCAMDERLRFIADWLDGRWSKSDLCRGYGISRPTVDKWIERYQAEGVEGLKERSRAPHHQRDALGDELVQRIIKLREQYPTFGPAKLRLILEDRHPGERLPAASSIGVVLKKAGLVVSRKRKPRACSSATPCDRSESSNHVWCADFKGTLYAGDGCPCSPLTISDDYSRFLLGCQGMRRTHGTSVQAVFEQVFRANGMPGIIRTDNGPPFASVGLGGLTRLAVWWIRLGIEPQRIEPGRPEQNGRHERMHRTLKDWLKHYPSKNYIQLLKQLDRFVEEYNWERPHQALGQTVPAASYQRSVCVFPGRLPEMDYDGSFQVRRVKRNGEISWKGRRWYLSEALAGERIGLLERDERYMEVYLGEFRLGLLDCKRKDVVRAKRLEKAGTE